MNIEPNVEYYVRNILLSPFMSTFKKYLYPLDLTKANIEIKGDNINYLYLQKDKTYTLDFKENTIKKMIILSRKTLDSKVIVKNNKEEKELNINSLYYKLEDEFKGQLILEVKENNAFIEFLSNEGEGKIEKLKDISLYEYETTKDTIVIKVENTQKHFEIKLASDKPFHCSFSYGYSNNEDYYYYNPNLKILSLKQDNSYLVLFSLFSPFKNIFLTDNEFLSFTVNIGREANQKILLSYQQSSIISPILDEKLDKTYCEGIIQNLQEMFEIYVFTDIAKNPPNIKGIENYHHEKIDIKKELGKIKTDNRYFYEFYQEVMKILTATKDIHLTLYSYKTPNGIPFTQYQVLLPFNYVIKKDNNNDEEEEFKVYIEANDNIKYYSESDQKFIKDHIKIPLKSINDMDPFDYIQNWSKFRATKNVHAQFTYAINFAISHFSLAFHPFNYSDFSIYEYEFEDNKILRLASVMSVPNIKDVEFNKFYEDYVKDKQKNSQNQFFQIPSVEEVREKYLIYKGIKKEPKRNLKEEIKEEKIEWNITLSSSEGELKCRVDEENQVNVVVQTSFSLGYYAGILKIIECAKLFYTNKYPIIIIESKNGGGTAQLYMVMHQLFQMRTVDRTYFSFRMSDLSKEHYKNKYFERTNAKTCKFINGYDDFEEITDNYDYNDLNIEHKRSEAMDILPFYFRNILRDFREEYKDNENLKKPTDIIIFTDSYSYSATCGLIKGFQNTGGAIIVGYYGNPKIKGIKYFDGSQSISSVESIQDLNLYTNLDELGFSVSQVTVGESFDDSVYDKNPIPREYAFDPVDDRVDIYSSYSDEIYKDFIEQGKIIHDKFNNKNYCNKNNDKLLLHINECNEIEGKPHAHGGYKCQTDKNEWDTSKCQPYYCDIGYYFDQGRKECLEECNFKDTKSHLIYADIYDLEYEIEKDKVTTFTFLNDNQNNYYFYNSSEDLVTGYPKIGFVDSETLFLNQNQRATNNFNITINRIKADFQFLKYNRNSIGMSNIRLFHMKLILLLQSPQDHIFYGENMLKYETNKVKHAIYNNDMKLEDIIEGNDNYFTEYKEKDSFINLLKDEINIIIIDYPTLTQIHYFIGPKNISENIEIIDKNTNFIYLQKDKIYVLDFKNNKINRMIKLSRKTLSSEIKIVGENSLLNSDNIYYPIKDDFKGEITLEVTKSDAILEFLFKFDDVEILDYENLNKKTAKKKF